MKESTKDKSKITRIVSIINLLILSVVILGCTNTPVPNEPEVHRIEYVDSLVQYNEELGGRERYVGMMKDSLQEGLWVTIYPNGMIASISFYEKGKLNGPLTSFWENGQMSFYCELKDGIEHGKVYSWHSNGKLSQSYGFTDGKEDGVYETFDEEGNLISSREYKDGEYIRTIYGIPLLIDETAE